MGLYIAAPIALLLSLAQTTVIRNVTLFGAHVDLLLLFAISWVLCRGLGEGLMIGVIGGLVLDVSSAGPFGTATLSLAVAISLAALGEVNLFQGAWYLKFIVAAGATLLVNVVNVLVLRLAGYGAIPWAALGTNTMPSVLAHLLLVPLVYGVTKWLARRLEPKRVEF
ncbi:MAG: rod shape-determining protein MreD [Anaerolineae bacterium]|jgi:rod shape-determining protein MreD|nr:rod shape-determining protein MreD [Chloroflexota bacterium]